jgi:hypothetical protein
MKHGTANKLQMDFKNVNPMVEMLKKEIQSLCNFSFLKTIKIEPANKVQILFQKEMPSVPVKHHFSYLSLH